jgi:hypothetical protein
MKNSASRAKEQVKDTGSSIAEKERGGLILKMVNRETFDFLCAFHHADKNMASRAVDLATIHFFMNL